DAVARVEAALALNRIGDPGARHPDRREILLIRLDGRGPLGAAEEFVDRREQQTLAAGEFLRVFRPALRRDDRHQVVRAELLFDELAHPAPHEPRVERLPWDSGA